MGEKMIKKIFIFLILFGFVYGEKVVSDEQIKKNHSRHNYVKKVEVIKKDYKIENGWLWCESEGIPIKNIDKIKIENLQVSLWKCDYNNVTFGNEREQLYFLLMKIKFDRYEQIEFFILELTGKENKYNVETKEFKSDK